MIIVRSPLRISFVGGGSDLPAFCDHEDGHVVSAAITHSVYVMVAPRLDDKIRVSYSKTELVDDVNDIEHDIVREAVKSINPNFMDTGIEIVSMADLSSGAGLGSSGAFTVGLVQALRAYDDGYCSPIDLFDEASEIEMDLCKHSCGYQDQAASAFGGLRFYTFREGDVRSDDLSFSKGSKLLEDRLLLVDLGLRGPSNDILKRQSDNIDDSRTRADVQSMANLAVAFRDALVDHNIDKCCDIVDASWALKRSFTNDVSNDLIDEVYTFAREHGALGGKLCGAGGRGMLLLLSRKNGRSILHGDILLRYPDLNIIAPGFSPYGSNVVWSSS